MTTLNKLSMSPMKIKLGKVCVGLSLECRYIPHNFANKKMHWAKMHKWNKAWKDEVGWRIYENMKELRKLGLPLDKCHMTITLYATHLMDTDGAYRAVKPLVDAFTEQGIIKDDSVKYLILEVKQIKVNHLVEQHVEIEIRGA